MLVTKKSRRKVWSMTQWSILKCVHTCTVLAASNWWAQLFAVGTDNVKCMS